MEGQTNIIKQEDINSILNLFNESYRNSIKDLCIKFRNESGLGALFINLTQIQNDFDIEYFLLKDLDGNLRNKVENYKNYYYYVVNFNKKSYIFYIQ